MDQDNQPTRLDVDRARQIIGDTTHDAAYTSRREALAWRTLGCVEGLANLDDPARAIRLIRAALRAERELSAIGTPEYETIMAEPVEQTADRPCPVCGNYPSACTCRIGDGSPRYDITSYGDAGRGVRVELISGPDGDRIEEHPVHTGIGADCRPDCSPIAHRCGVDTSERDCPPCDCNRRQRGGSHLQRCAILAWERRQIESATATRVRA